ncbi:hypothetical protein DRJ16_00270 [Candidatus Woesearchaeota archaeon]|nr:MAG: hypothetical protein DRJ16_00270 [Candidatus Woesearchaeota archaeon]
MNPSEDKPKIRFVKNLHYHANAICLYWIDEIHIDEKFKDHPLLSDIIKHELKHYIILKKIINEKSLLKKMLWGLYNDFWDFYDCFRLTIKYYWLVIRKWLKNH